MLTFSVQGIEADVISHHNVLLPDAWRKMRSWWQGDLRYTLAKAWDCGQHIVAFSSWTIGQSSLACTLEYHKEAKSCKVTVRMSGYANRRLEEKFADVLQSMLISPTHMKELSSERVYKTQQTEKKSTSQTLLGISVLFMGFILTTIPVFEFLSGRVILVAYQFLAIGIILDLTGLALLTTSNWWKRDRE